METAVMERRTESEQLPTLSGQLIVSVRTAFRTEQVYLRHSLVDYLRGAYLFRARAWKKTVKQAFPFEMDRLLYLESLMVEAESRDPFTMVHVSGIDRGRLVYGVGFAKRSMDVPRLERGVSLALDRAIDDLLCKMAVGVYRSNGNGA